MTSPADPTAPRPTASLPGRPLLSPLASSRGGPSAGRRSAPAVPHVLSGGGGGWSAAPAATYNRRHRRRCRGLFPSPPPPQPLPAAGDDPWFFAVDREGEGGGEHRCAGGTRASCATFGRPARTRGGGQRGGPSGVCGPGGCPARGGATLSPPPRPVASRRRGAAWEWGGAADGTRLASGCLAGRLFVAADAPSAPRLDCAVLVARGEGGVGWAGLAYQGREG